MLLKSSLLVPILFAVSIAYCAPAKGQDFLKQLEEKLAPKNQSEKKESKDGESETLPVPKNGSETTKEAPSNPFLLPGESDQDNNQTNGGMELNESNLPKPIRPIPDQPIPNLPVRPKFPRGTPAPNRPNPNVPGAAPSIELGPEQGVGPANDSSDTGYNEPGYNEPGYLGLVAERIPGGGLGLMVVDITQGSPAWKAGFQRGDRILAVGGNAISTLDELASQLGTYRAGSAVRFLISRNGRNKDITAVLMNRSVASRTQGIPNPNNSTLGIPGGGNNYTPVYPDINRSGGAPAAGMSVADLSEYFRRQFGIPAYRGAAVTEVVAGSPADQAGLKAGDCIIEVDQKVVQRATDIQDWVRSGIPGQTSTLAYYRGRSLNQVQITLGSSDLSSGLLSGSEIDPSMLTAEYVSGLHGELDRVRQELAETQSRLQELELRLRTLEANRPRR